MPAWTFNNLVRTPLLLLGVVESVVVYSSVYFAALLQYGDLQNLPPGTESLELRAVLVTIVILASLIAMGLYQFHQRIYFHEAAARVFAAIGIGTIVLVVLSNAVPALMLSWEMAAVAALYALVLLLIVRLYFLRNVDENVFRRKTLIYGAGKRARAIAEFRRRADRRGFIIVGQLRAPGDRNIEGVTAITLGEKSICDLATERQADEIVVAMDDRRGNLPVRELLDCRLRGTEVIDLLEFLERESGKIRVDLVNPGWLIFSRGFRASRFRRFNKRLVDLLASTVLTIVAAPVMIICVLAIKWEDGLRAPVFYRQLRVGRNNQVFNVLKFRSMREDAETEGAVWAEQNDPRITRVGAVLRKYRLDELPQFINVVRGQMSLVGPRPERPEFVESLKQSIPYYSERHTVNPGVTGWAQLHYAYGSNEEDAMEKLQYDLYYVKNHSLLLDLVILLQTVEVVLWGKGAR